MQKDLSNGVQVQAVSYPVVCRSPILRPAVQCVGNKNCNITTKWYAHHNDVTQIFLFKIIQHKDS